MSPDLDAEVLLLNDVELGVGQDGVGQGVVDVALMLGHGSLQDGPLDRRQGTASLHRHAPDAVAH